MQPYIIQYPSTYLNCRESQRPIITNSDPARIVRVNGNRGEKNEKQEDKCLQPSWCPSGLSHTQMEEVAADA